MLEIVVTPEFNKRYRDLPLIIRKKAEKQEKLFRKNPFYPSLHTEKLEPKDKQVWSFRIDKQYRIIFNFIATNKVIFLTVWSHSWIYKF